ncbi:DUF4956 domain-containing protein [Ruminococcaceae bacterium OttesenSCG-928-A16]|nr:DUF4956 domain-containing protein [Ruminococcaceae bacterium OttesenSCG-928-A16]
MLENLFNFTFLSKAASISVLDILFALAISFALGLFIFFVYKKTFNGVMYSSSFGISLIAMDMITTLIILAVSSNLIASLGMVGALSIVRFRTVIKEPLDLVFLFWSITAGIIVGVGLIPLAVIGSVVIGVILFVFVNKKTTDTPYVMIISCEDNRAEADSIALIKAQAGKYLLKSKTVSAGGVELTLEVRLKENTAKLVNNLLAVGGVQNAVLVSYNGEYYM